KPVADQLWTVADPILRLGQLAAEAAAHSRLLLDLAKRRLLVRLSGVELALRQRPVVVARAVDEQHSPVTHHHSAGRTDPLRHARHGTWGRIPGARGFTVHDSRTDRRPLLHPRERTPPVGTGLVGH